MDSRLDSERDQYISDEIEKGNSVCMRCLCSFKGNEECPKCGCIYAHKPDTLPSIGISDDALFNNFF